MAKDGKETKPVTDAKPPRRWPLVVAVVMANLITLGGVIGYFSFFHAGAQTAAAAAPAEAPPTEYGPLHELTPLIANLSDRSAGRFVRVTVHLEAKDDDALATVAAREVPIRHRLLIFFSELDVAKASAPGGKEALRDELVPAINEVIGADLVRRVYFSEFVLQ
jgi:flagellar FliL protein